MKKLHTLFLLSLITTSLFSQTLPAYLPADGLVAWYPFNGNANDESGNNLNLSVQGPILNQDRNGLANSAYFFNGTAANAQYLINQNINLLKNNSYTYSAWINCSEFYPNVFQTNPFQYDIFYYQGVISINNSNNWSIGPAISFSLNAGENSKIISAHWVQNQSNYQYFVSNNLINTNNWYQFICTYNQGVQKLYVNGILIAENSFTLSYDNQNDFIIGGQRNGTQMQVMGGFKGNIDDIAIYNRALTQEEITALYTGTPVNDGGGNTSANAVPPGIPYQAVVRNANGQVAANTAVTTRFTLRQTTADGAIEFKETHSLTTNAQGLMSTVLGQGIAVQNTFAAINWANTTKFLQVEVDLSNGYVDLGTQQLMSVPYSIQSQTALTINNTGLPVYANNAAALAGGLTSGQLYRTATGDLKIVY